MYLNYDILNIKKGSFQMYSFKWLVLLKWREHLLLNNKYITITAIITN